MNQRKFILFAFLASILTVLVWYLIIEPFIFKRIYSQDIFAFWAALSKPIGDLYQNFGFIYPPFFWYEFHVLGYSWYILNGFVIATQIIGFPLGLYLIQRKFQLQHPEILMAIIFVPFTFDIALRNFNTFLFLICAIIIYLYDRRPVIAGLLLLVIAFKITIIIIILFVFVKSSKSIKIKYLLGMAISVFIIYIFFPLSGYTVMDYLQKVTEGTISSGGSINIFLTISRVIHIEHMVWIAPVIFSFIFLLYKQRREKTETIETIEKMEITETIEKLETIEKTEKIKRTTKENISNNKKTPRYFYNSIIITLIFEIVLGAISIIAYIKWTGSLYI